ncbi:MAG TPA: hypothetical protein V6C89_00330 [Drouetiella sp.]|jgi:hypothetical protein
MNELDRSSPLREYNLHDTSVALSQYLTDDMQSRAREAAGKVAPTHDYLGVAKDLGNGVINEVVSNPGQMLATFGESAMAGAALRFAPAPVRAAMVAGSLAYGAYELGQNAPKWISDASTVVNGSTRNALELAQAHANLEHLGGGIAEFGAGVGGVGVGMHLPEIRTAGTSSWNAYRNGDITKGQIFPTFKEGFGQEAAKVDWTKNPDWVKPASEAINAKAAGMKIWGENALNSPAVQNATGALRTGAEHVRTFVSGKLGRGGEVETPAPESTPSEAPAPAASPADASASVQVDTAATPADAPAVTPGEALDKSPTAPGESGDAKKRPVAIRLEPGQVEEVETPAEVHRGTDAAGAPFEVTLEPDHFAAQGDAVAPTPAAAEGEATAAPGAEQQGRVIRGVDGAGNEVVITEEPDHFAAKAEAADGAPTAEKLAGDQGT